MSPYIRLRGYIIHVPSIEAARKFYGEKGYSVGIWLKGRAEQLTVGWNGDESERDKAFDLLEEALMNLNEERN